jgi:hypothetical protein
MIESGFKQGRLSATTVMRVRAVIAFIEVSSASVGSHSVCGKSHR